MDNYRLLIAIQLFMFMLILSYGAGIEEGKVRLMMLAAVVLVGGIFGYVVIEP